MKILKLLIAIVLIASIVMSMSGCQLIDDIIGGGTDKPSPSVSEKPTETDKPTTPSPDPTTPEVKTYIVTFDSNVTAKVGGTAIVSGDKVKSGSTVIFTAKVVEGKEFIKFWNNGVAISGSNPCTYTVTADMYVSPEYGVQHKLTFDEGISVINNVTGKSIISGDFIKAKTSITVKADVPQGKSFVKFFTKSSPGIILSHTSNPSTFNSYDFDYHLSVEYEPIQLNISLDSNVTAEIIPKAFTGGFVDYGTKISLIAKDVAGKRFKHFLLVYDVAGYYLDQIVLPVAGTNYGAIIVDSSWHIVAVYEDIPISKLHGRMLTLKPFDDYSGVGNSTMFNDSV